MLRSMVPRRAAAAAATGALAAAGLLVLSPAAHAATVSPVVECVLPMGQGTFTGAQDVTVALDKTTVGQGGTLKGSVTLGVSPAVSAFDIHIWATPSITLAMKGAATGEVTIVGAEQQIDVKAGQAPVVVPYEGNFSIPASATAGGNIDFTVVKMVTDARLSPGSTPLPTVCTVKSGGDAVVANVGVEGAASQDPTLTAPTGEVRPGTTIALSGTNFTPSSIPILSLCAADGTNCSQAKFSGNTLKIDAQGNLSGDANLKGDVADGAYSVKVVGGGKEARANLTVKSFVPTEPRTFTSDRTSGPLGTTVKLAGENWLPNQSVLIVQTDELGLDGSNTIAVTADSMGAFSATYTVTDTYTTQIRARQGIDETTDKYVPFTITTGPAPISQSASVTLAPGALSMTQAGDGINFGSATLDGSAQKLNANLNQVTVLDARGGNLGWSLTGTMTDLVAGNGTDKIPAGNISWTPSCAATAGSLSTVTSGSAGALGADPATLCSQAGDQAKTTGGKFTADAQVTLTTPQFAAAGSYTGTLTLTLI
ncbi:hypothetical protein ACPA54_23900 [Uniformispora flossi]|uniref:hypothetical protein n=1 Tax=Uniformispora flossi TaxID=3390723 RepID=UPI003C30AF05